MDFIEQLSELQGYTDILVIVDQLTKQAVFIPTQQLIDSSQLTELFINYIFTKYRVLSHITSDQGLEFVFKFFKSLASSLNIRLYYISGYYPEANGQAEQTNQMLEQYLCHYCNYQQND